ncbi:MAG: hypothetical protein JW888_17350 [Pirellulales bacterium]|nr:hypothetical protein [Pirellulales bacterium]
MPIEFRCTQCGKLLRTPDATSGQQAKCPACGAVITVPETTPGPASGGQDSFGAAPGYDAPRSENPYQAPADYTVGDRPFAPGPVAGVRPTRIDFGDVFGQTWDIFKDQWGMCLLVALVCWIMSMVAGQIPNIAGMGCQAAGREMAVIGLFAVQIPLMLAVWVFQLWIGIGQAIFFIKTARGQAAEFTDVFTGAPYFLRVLGASILFGLGVVLILGVCIGPCALLGGLAGDDEGAVMGLILGAVIGGVAATVFSLTFGQYFYLIIDQNLGILDSLSTSSKVTSGNKLTMFAIGMVVGILGGLFVLCTCLIGILVVMPYVALLNVVMYLLMIGHATAAQRQYAQPPLGTE